MRFLVIEDLQWLDPSSEELLRHLTLEARSLRLMLLMTRACRCCGTRLELGGVREIRLAPLSAKDVQAHCCSRGRQCQSL